KIERLAPRFLNETEMACITTDHKLLHLHLFWGAKESLYKAYGRKELDFREHIPIAPFIPNPAGGTCSGRVCKDDFEADFDIRYAVSEGDFVWVYAVQRMEKLAR
ncbi:MAG TPA: 4'-phosphopantetheinyl transferase superfamily protein, partial [Saprospiraceae bacterium]|nr:4'-phosphopantetheinyl transferase superfamily protein [Saprospiraceae bacterium]